MRVILICLFFSSCAHRARKSVPNMSNWSIKKRTCHTHYMDRFGLKPTSAVMLCKEELGISE